MEDTITISKSELQELIAKEIANRAIKTRRDFGGVAIDASDIRSVNQLYPDIFDKMRLPFYNSHTDDVMPIARHQKWKFDFGGGDVFSRNRHFSKSNNAYYHSKDCLYVSRIHEKLKEITLALHGATLIKDLDDEEFQEALETYNDFKQFFLERYKVRLSKLQHILRQK